ncbi:hypothetical protein Tco_0455917 [Tanacetum coccineum]
MSYFLRPDGVEGNSPSELQTHELVATPVVKLTRDIGREWGLTHQCFSNLSHSILSVSSPTSLSAPVTDGLGGKELRYLFCVNKVVHEEFKLQEFVKSVVAYQKKLGSTTKHRKGDAIEAVAARITYRLRRSMEVKSIYELAFKSSCFRNWGYNLGLEVAV